MQLDRSRWRQESRTDIAETIAVLFRLDSGINAQYVGLDKIVPFLLENRLEELGARFVGGPDWQPHAVRHGNLITGQNPQSSELVARHVLEALGEAA